ncbi:MAG: diguanylate cyclase [Anaerovorax sp.]
MKKIKNKKIKKILFFILMCLPFYIVAAKTDLKALSLLMGMGMLFVLFTLYAIYQNRKIHRMLRKERDYFKKILDKNPFPLFIVNGQYRLDFMNAAAIELFDCKEDMVGKPCCCLNTCICHTPDCAIKKMENNGNRCTYYEKNGKRYMVSTALLNHERETDGKYIEMLQDVTQIVETQKTLEEKTVELETMYENLIGGVLITTMNEGFPVIRCNQGYGELIGKREEEIIGQSAMQWVLPEDAAKLTKRIENQLVYGNCVNLEHRLCGENHVVVWVSLRGKRTVLRGENVGVWILTDISGKKEAELALKVDEERYRIAMQSIEDIIIDYDMKTHTMYHSSKAKEIYGVPELVENMPQSILDSGTVLAESKNEYLEVFRQLDDGVKKCSCVLQARAADGRILWNRLTFTAIFDDEGNTVRAIGILQDITREKSVELRYKREARYLKLSGKEGTFYYEVDLTGNRFISGHETIVNAYCKSPTDDFNRVMELLINHMVYEADRELVHAQINREILMRNYEEGISHKIIEYRRDMNGELIWVSCSLQSFVDEETESVHCIGCIRNIHEMKQREILLQHKAERDLLTGLYNKVTTESLIKCAIQPIVGGEMSGALLLIDLDNFKNVNDQLGHAFGDEVLSQVSQGLLLLFGKDDIVGRIGGDEFLAYMNQVKDETLVIEKAQQICHMFHHMYTGINKDYKISGTIGIAMFPSHGENFSELYKNADGAMYYAKEQGKDKYAIYPGFSNY